MKLPEDVLNEIMRSATLLADLGAMADCGGRLAGSQSEQLCHRWLMERLKRTESAVVREQVFQHEGWRRRSATLEIVGGSCNPIRCHSLILSPDTRDQGLVAEVVDVGRGTTADFDSVGSKLKGRIALVEHEYPFGSNSIHRRVKYDRSRDEGCVAFMIANNLKDGGLVTGSSGLAGSDDIPAIGIGYDTRLIITSERTTPAQVRIDLKSERFSAEGRNIVADLSSGHSETVILCAHYDGHDLAESAMDNATGVAAALEILRVLSPYLSKFRRNLRVIFFTNEEWRLLGSNAYIESLTENELSSISMVINLDTMAGSANLSALTSGYDELKSLVAEASVSCHRDIAIVAKLLRNSDHYNFAIRGVPALRLIVGFDEPIARTRYLLTEGDTRDKIEPLELKSATIAAASVVWNALTRPLNLKHKSIDEMQELV